MKKVGVNMGQRGRPPKNKTSTEIKVPRPRGRPPKKEKIILMPCLCCGRDYDIKNFYSSNSILYKIKGKIPYCKSCISLIYNEFLQECKTRGYRNPEQKATQRICMSLDLYYSDALFENAMNDYVKNKDSSNNELSFMSFYIRHAKLTQYSNKDYNSTILEDYQDTKKNQKLMSTFNDNDWKQDAIVEKASKFFGAGLNRDDYLFLQNEYDDWTARHECQTKAQEELIKQICFTQLSLFKALRSGEDSKAKDLNATLIKQMDAAKLQPKQNKVNTTAETQTLGTLIEQWETTKPIPPVDDELKDVHKLGLFLDVFFKGHLARMMGLKNGVSKYYDEYMKKFTVNKTQRNSDDEENIENDSEAIFDALFGSSVKDN